MRGGEEGVGLEEEGEEEEGSWGGVGEGKEGEELGRRVGVG